MSPRTIRIVIDAAVIAGAIAATFVASITITPIWPDLQRSTVILIVALFAFVVAILVMAARMKFGTGAAIAARILLLILLIGLVTSTMQFAADMIVVAGHGHVQALVASAVMLAIVGMLLLPVLYVMRWRPRMLLFAVPALLLYVPFLSFDGPWVYTLCGSSEPHRLYAPPPPPGQVQVASCGGAPAEMPTIN